VVFCVVFGGVGGFFFVWGCGGCFFGVVVLFVFLVGFFFWGFFFLVFWWVCFGGGFGVFLWVWFGWCVLFGLVLTGDGYDFSRFFCKQII